MFVFYFGIMADLTPPVALAAFAAAPMAQGLGQKIALQATKLAVAGYVVPFMAVFTPALMLQDGGADRRQPRLSGRGRLRLPQGLPRHRALGRRRGRLPRRRRCGSGSASLAAAAAVLLVLALPLTDEAGFALAAVVDRAALVAARAPGRGMSLCVPPAPRRCASPSTAFTLGWTHSVEHVALGGGLAGDARRPQSSSRRGSQGSGAGMEPPDGARLAGGWWIWRPDRPPQAELVLAASGATGGGWTLCAAGACRELGATPGAPIRLTACG